MNILTKEFFERDTLIVAKELLGSLLVHIDSGIRRSGIIVETEAYMQNDPACHAYKGRTKRAVTLFKEPGLSYVYFIYGMYYCMNIVTEPFDTAGAVLIRALEPVENLENSNGPGKLCRAMNITKDLNEVNVCSPNSPLIVCEGKNIDEKQIVTTTRIGIKNGVDFPWRFYLKDNLFVSKK